MNGRVRSQKPSGCVRSAKVHTGIKKEKLTQNELKKHLHYNPETGIFTWKLSARRPVCIGDVAGCYDKRAYIVIRIENVLYLAHRLAWLYMEGYHPENQIDHKNGNKHDNRWKNLREATQTCNSQNTKILKNNTSGFPGVSWSEKRHKWKCKSRNTRGLRKRTNASSQPWLESTR